MATLKKRMNLLPSGHFSNLVECAWLTAMDNAFDTHGFADVENDEYWEIGYLSIASTSQFCENKEVKAWYAKNGYNY